MLQKIMLLLIQAIEIYSYALIIWVLGSWFPQLRNTKFFAWIDKIVYPYAKVFRGLIPPLGGFDFSIIVAFFVLNIAQSILSSFFASFASVGL